MPHVQPAFGASCDRRNSDMIGEAVHRASNGRPGNQASGLGRAG